MNKKKDSLLKNQNTPANSTLALLTQWFEQHHFGAAMLTLLLLAVLVLLFLVFINRIEQTWYSAIFQSSGYGLLWNIVFVGINMARWLYVLALISLAILILFQSSENLFAFTIRFMLYGGVIVYFLIGLQNLILYSVVGWNHLGIIAVGEGLHLFLVWMVSVVVILGSKFQPSGKTIIFESLFNLAIVLSPVIVIITISLGGFEENTQWMNIIFILIGLLILVLGVDELKGKPSIYVALTATFRVLEAGHASLQLLQKRSAEALANALTAFNRMPLEQQETLAQWILDNKKPSFRNQFWAIAKIVTSTILLTTLVQEPAIIAFKWFLKTLFGFSY